MLKKGILAIAAVAALMLGAVSFGTQNANAAVTDTASIWSGFFATELGAGACDGLSAVDIQTLADELGDEDGELTVEDLAAVDLDANQVTDENAAATAPGGACGLDEIYVIAFVDDDEAVTFDAEAGVTVHINDQDGGLEAADANAEICEAEDDLDCDNSTPSSDDGDGVVVATIVDATADAGDEVDVEVSQADAASTISTENLSIVGAADNIAVSEVANKATVQTDAGDCEDEADVSEGGQIADVDKTFVQAVVTDDDDVALTRVAVEWTVEDEDISFIPDPADPDQAGETGVSVDAGDVGIAAFAVVCGGTETGVNTITGEEQVGLEDESVEITTVGEPAAIALTASPAGIVCDGSTSSTVTATVTDSEGNNVAGGTNVNFSVVALGTANPINFGTVDGQASSQITPLAGTLAGVTVVVTSGEAQSSILVGCNTPGAEGTPIVPVPTATPPGGVTPPDTGNGGYLGQDSSDSSSMWVLLALGLGAVALVGGGVIARRAAK